ncbi:HNH endonuclease [Clostridium estertheticum]|nr:HNH endonuclease [Clostridium estertheticum]
MNIIWRVPRADRLEEQHNECQMCKDRGLVEPATMVHHIKLLRYHPELALEKDNLMSLCGECHWLIHHPITIKKQLNEERW